jgi:hypothetical protein
VLPQKHCDAAKERVLKKKYNIENNIETGRELTKLCSKIFESTAIFCT